VFLVAGEEERRECLRPHREAKDLVAENAFGYQLANRIERTEASLGLPVVLDHARRKARGCPAVDEGCALERGAHELDLLGREHIADHDLHQKSSAACQRSNTRWR